MNPRTIRSIIDGQELVSTHADTLVSDAARVMKQRRVGAIIVLDGDKLAGIFTERDALFRVVAEGRDPNATAIAEVMTRNPVTIHPDRPFASALEIMHNGRFRHVPVAENGRPIGMVSSRDAMGAELEQFMYTLIVEEQQRDILA
jgi:CBS domain-containing protein